MTLLTAGLVAMLVGMMLMGFVRSGHVKDQEQLDMSAANAFAAVQSAILLWHVTVRLPAGLDEDRFEVGGDTGAVDAAMDELVNALPTAGGELTFDSTVISTLPVVTISGFPHGGGDVIGLVWRNRVVEIHLFGDYSEERVAGVIRHVPNAARVERLVDEDNDPATPATCVEALRSSQFHVMPSCERPGHRDADHDESVAIVMPHPVLAASLRDVVAVEDEAPKYGSPLVFDGRGAPQEYAGCGGINALTLAGDGTPMACVDLEGGNGFRVWKRLESPDAADGYCVDSRNGPNSSTKAPNVVLAFKQPTADAWGRRLTSERERTMTGSVLKRDGTTTTVVCPEGWSPISGKPLFCEPKT